MKTHRDTLQRGELQTPANNLLEVLRNAHFSLSPAILIAEREHVTVSTLFRQSCRSKRRLPSGLAVSTCYLQAQSSSSTHAEQHHLITSKASKAWVEMQ
jgi:hypothetical protein